MLYRKRLEQIRHILDTGRDINIQDTMGETILMHAIRIGDIQVIDLLLEYKARLDFSIRNIHGSGVFSYITVLLSPSIIIKFPDMQPDTSFLQQIRKELLSFAMEYSATKRKDKELLKFSINLSAMEGINIDFIMRILKYVKTLDLSVIMEILRDIPNVELQVSILETLRFAIFVQRNEDICHKSAIRLPIDLGSQDDFMVRIAITEQLDVKNLMSLSWSTTEKCDKFREHLTSLLSLYTQFKIHQNTKDVLPSGFQVNSKEIYRAIEKSLKDKTLLELKELLFKRHKIIGECSTLGQHTTRFTGGLAQLLYQHYSTMPIIPEEQFYIKVKKS